MGRKELEELLNQLQSKNSNALLIPSDEKNPAARLDAASIEAQNSRTANTSDSQTGGDEMAKWTALEIDEHRSRNRMKVRKVPEVQQGALAVVRATVPQATAPVVSETVATFVEPDVVHATYRPPSPIAPAATPSRLHRLLRWMFVAPTVAPPVGDLVQLKRELKEWTALQIKIDKLEKRYRRFAIRSEIARYIFLIITAAFYVLLACAAIRI
jgi:hypothetical protein